MTNATMPQVPICGVGRQDGLWWERHSMRIRQILTETRGVVRPTMTHWEA